MPIYELAKYSIWPISSLTLTDGTDSNGGTPTRMGVLSFLSIKYFCKFIISNISFQIGGGPPPTFKPVLEAVLEAMAQQSRFGCAGSSAEMGCSESSQVGYSCVHINFSSN